MIDAYLKQMKISYELDVDLKRITWIHRGGVVKYFVIPKDVYELCSICTFLYRNNIKFDLVGHTSNLYFLNDYNPYIIVTTKYCNTIEEKKEELVCDCGVSVIRLAKQCVKKGICGFEYLTLLPGTVGAAVYNNSSCKKNSISSLVEKIDFLTDTGDRIILSADQLNFQYRTSSLKKEEIKGVILKVYLKVKYGNAIELIRIAKMNKKNRDLIFKKVTNSLGCTFDNPSLSLFYRFCLKIFEYSFRLVGVDQYTIDVRKRDLLLFMTGYSCLRTYICAQSYIIFMWKDEAADEKFPIYVEFANKVLHTKKLEIQIKSDKYGENKFIDNTLG